MSKKRIILLTGALVLILGLAFGGVFSGRALAQSGADGAQDVYSAGEAVTSNPAPLSDFEWPEVVLWDNGPLVTHPGGGAGGADESRLQNSSLLMTTLGFGHQVLNNNWVADDFVVSDAAGWTVDAATFFAYQTGSTTTSTMTNVNWILYDGDPSSGGGVITTGSGLQTSVWSNIYRATETTIGATDRPIMATTVNMGGLFLPAGTYWLAWQTDGSLGSGPWAPPITIIGQTHDRQWPAIAGRHGQLRPGERRRHPDAARLPLLNRGDSSRRRQHHRLQRAQPAHSGWRSGRRQRHHLYSLVGHNYRCRCLLGGDPYLGR